MNSSYSHYLPRAEETTKKIWEGALIVLDANALLNFYRWSSETSEEFFVLLEGVKDRLWIPDQVAFEYFENRESAIMDASSEYISAKKEIESVAQSFDQFRGHPHLSLALKAELDLILPKLTDELSQQAEQQKCLISNDPIRSRIVKLFDGKVGPSLNDEELDAAFKVGAVRYQNEIPPGYENKAKAKGGKRSDQRRAYGDFLLWKATIEKAKSDARDIIVVTEDSKEDWWKKKGGKVVGPRPEMISEFACETSQDVAIYRPESFLELAKRYIDAKVTDTAVSEVRAVSQKPTTTENDLVGENSSRIDPREFKPFRIALERARAGSAYEEALRSAGGAGSASDILAAVARTNDSSVFEEALRSAGGAGSALDILAAVARTNDSSALVEAARLSENIASREFLDLPKPHDIRPTDEMD